MYHIGEQSKFFVEEVVAANHRGERKATSGIGLGVFEGLVLGLGMSVSLLETSLGK